MAALVSQRQGGAPVPSTLSSGDGPSAGTMGALTDSELLVQALEFSNGKQATSYHNRWATEISGI